LKGNCAGARSYLEKIENDIKALGHQLKRKEQYVPSFREKYPFD
jgi:hypothetical protein